MNKTNIKNKEEDNLNKSKQLDVKLDKNSVFNDKLNLLKNNQEEVSKNVNETYSVNELGCVLKLDLTKKQKRRINEMLGCVRKVKNNKIAEIHQHNKEYLQIELYNEFKAKNPTVESKNPYRYVYPTQGYAESKNTGIEFIGPLQEDVYNNIYINGKHYLERIPSELYRNSIKDLMLANNKHISDIFNKNIAYANKRKSLRFISKNKYEESLFITSSDNIFKFINNFNDKIDKDYKIKNQNKINKNNNVLCFGKNFEESYGIEQEIKELTKNLNKKKINKELKLILENKLNKLSKKLEKDISYLGVLKYYLSKNNKTSKEIDFNTVKSIRIKKDKDNYYVSFTHTYHHIYKPTLLRLDNNKELTTIEELAFYIKELSDKHGKETALQYLKERTLGGDRNVNERIALSSAKNSNLNNNNELNLNLNLKTDNQDLEVNNEEVNESNNNFINYSEKIKRLIKKLEAGIEYHQKQLKRRTKGSRGYNKSLKRLRKNSKKVADIKLNENHQITHELVNDYNFPIFAIEKLNLKGMTKKPIPKIDLNKSLHKKHNLELGLNETTLNELVEKLEEYYKENVKGLKFKEIVGDYKLVFGENKASAKAGLNKSLLGNNLGQFARLLKYKSLMNGKLVIEVPAHYSSQECSCCGHVDKRNRIKAKFCCVKCGHEDHADHNASKVIAGRVYQVLIDLTDKSINQLLKKESDKKLNNKVKINKNSAFIGTMEDISR